MLSVIGPTTTPPTIKLSRVLAINEPTRCAYSAAVSEIRTRGAGGSSSQAAAGGSGGGVGLMRPPTQGLMRPPHMQGVTWVAIIGGPA